MPPNSQFKTLVYSPDAKIMIEGVDVSADLVRGGVNRITGGASSLQFTLSNKDLRYNDRFKRMDRVSVYLRRLEWKLVFTGYLDKVPGIQLYASTVTFKASCTIKRILYTQWDPGLPASLALLNQYAIPFGGSATAAPATGTTAPADAGATPATGTDQPQSGTPGSTTGDGAGGTPTPANTGGGLPTQFIDETQQKDTGLGQMLKNLLEKVGGWDRDDISVQTFPEVFLGYITERMPEIENLDDDSVAAFKKMFDYDEATGASAVGGTPGGGGVSNSTFTTLGPPSNGSNYNDMELVWIVTNAGWSGEDVVIGCSIITAESGGRPDAINTANSDGSIDSGLWQINSIHDGKYPGESRMDPAVSTKIARDLYKARGNWDDWSTLVYHGTAQQHFPRFRAIAGTGGTMPPGTVTNGGGNTGTAPAPGGAPGGAQVISNTGATAPVAKDPNMPDTSGMGVQDAIIAVTNYRFPGIFSVMSKSRSEPGSDHDFSVNKAVDLSNGPGDGPSSMTPEMDQLAAWWKQNYLGKGIRELIHWGPDNVWNDQPDGDGMSIYGASTMAQHYNHVHISMEGVVSADGTSTAGALAGAGGAGGGGAGTTTFQNKLAKNIFTYLFNPSAYAQEISTELTGRYASVNDQSLIQMVRALCEAGMREFQSAPSGEFLAFYPDYFGLDNDSAPKLKLEDVELKNFNIDINDDALTTHVFTMGAMSFEGNVEQTELGYMRSPGVVTVEDEFLFKIATQGMFFTPEFSSAEEMLARYGVRPLKRKYPNIYQEQNKEAMLLVAIKLFMQKWAEQYQTTVDLTFMPELFPGMRVELVGHDLIVYVKSVSHTFDFEGGFSTSAQVMAPMSASRTALSQVSDGS